MWFFRAPHIIFGDDALSHLQQLKGNKAFIVTDANIHQLGLTAPIETELKAAGFQVMIFDEVEPNPSLQTVQRGAKAMLAYEPDWVVGVGGGSSMDAAKAMWILYERPDLEPAAIGPMEDLGLRAKARLVCIPTTAGTGSEAGFGMVITDTESKQKLTLASPEATPDIAIVDPMLTQNLPPQITADTGIDVLTHAVEAYTCSWANDFTDGLCLQAARLVKTYLPRAVANGADDWEAREKMANAATMAGLTLGNSSVALAHAMSHSSGAFFKHVPHGRLTAVYLPYTIEFIANSGMGRYVELARIFDIDTNDEETAGLQLAAAIRDFLRQIGQPTSLEEAGVTRQALEEALPTICEHVEVESGTLVSRRMPEDIEEIKRLFYYAYEGKPVDF